MSTSNIDMRTIPEDSTKLTSPDSDTVVYQYESNGPCAVGFSGKRKNHDFKYRFPTEDARKTYVGRHFKIKADALKEKEQFKIDTKAREAKEFEAIEIGDIFVCSWGYEQTNVDAYQLIALKGKTGTFQAIALESLETASWASDYVRPIKDDFLKTEPFTKRLSGDHFKLSSFRYVSKMEDTKEKYYRSWYA